MTNPCRRALVAAVALLLGASLTNAIGAESQPATVLITGSSRGIGLEFARQYAEQGWRVIATARNLETAQPLKELAAKHSNIRLETLDVTNGEQIAALAARLKDRPIDVLINNVGDTGEFKGQFLGKLDHERFGYYMETNAHSAIRMAEAFLPHVQASGQKKMIAISSLAGSFGAKGGGQPGGYWYKASKAAMNMLMLTLSQDVKAKGVIVASLSPGLVDTHNYAARGIRLPNTTAVDVSVGGMIKVIEGLTIEQTGQFIRYGGEVQPW